MFVGFNHNHHNILLTQALLPDESMKSHIWMFKEILKVTDKQPAVIITNADSAVDSTVCQVFVQNYLIHCVFHMTQNINKHLKNSLASNYENFIEAFYICKNSLTKETFERRFEGLRQNFPETSFYLKVLYRNKAYWAYCFIHFKFTSNMISSSCIELVNGLCSDNQEIKIPDASVADIQQILLKELIHLVEGLNNVIEGIICKHYFRIMLTNDNAKFHIWLIPSCWYYNNTNMSKEPFLKANKFYEKILTEETAFPISYLCAFNQDNQDFLEK
ncbi:22469_t:CDS:2, partial [Cetraspora pellucida]